MSLLSILPASRALFCPHTTCCITAFGVLPCEPLTLYPCASPPAAQVGPRMSFSTAWCANALSICASCGLGPKVDRVEVSRRYLLRCSAALAPGEAAAFAALVHDRMT